MKKTAVLIYNGFCNFEISVALEMLALYEKPVTVFAVNKLPVKSEDGLTVMPDEIISELKIEEYDSLILPGANDIREAVEDEKIIEFVNEFVKADCTIGAISIAPVLLLKSGALCGKPFLCGADKEDLAEEGFGEAELEFMHGWTDNIKNPIECGYIITGKIITSVSYNFVKWAMALGKMLNIDIPPETFGLKK